MLGQIELKVCAASRKLRKKESRWNLEGKPEIIHARLTEVSRERLTEQRLATPGSARHNDQLARREAFNTFVKRGERTRPDNLDGWHFFDFLEPLEIRDYPYFLSVS